MELPESMAYVFGSVVALDANWFAVSLSTGASVTIEVGDAPATPRLGEMVALRCALDQGPEGSARLRLVQLLAPTQELSST